MREQQSPRSEDSRAICSLTQATELCSLTVQRVVASRRRVERGQWDSNPRDSAGEAAGPSCKALVGQDLATAAIASPAIRSRRFSTSQCWRVSFASSPFFPSTIRAGFAWLPRLTAWCCQVRISAYIWCPPNRGRVTLQLGSHVPLKPTLCDFSMIEWHRSRKELYPRPSQDTRSIAGIRDDNPSPGSPWTTSPST